LRDSQALTKVFVMEKWIKGRGEQAENAIFLDKVAGGAVHIAGGINYFLGGWRRVSEGKLGEIFRSLCVGGQALVLEESALSEPEEEVSF
jgi:hypothetical protein